MCFSTLPLEERIERASRIEFSGIAVQSYAPEYLESYQSEAKKEAKKMVEFVSNTNTWLHAVQLVRKHYAQWKGFLKRPSGPAPHVFKSFIDDKMLVFYLFLGDHLNIFRLNPRFPFISGETFDDRKLLVQGRRDNNFCDVKFVVKTWESLGSPWTDSRCGKDLSCLAKEIKKSKARKEKQSNFCLAWHFWELTSQFGVYWCLSDSDHTEETTERVLFDFYDFIQVTSISIASDRPGMNSLETIGELFPEFPKLVAFIIHEYCRTVVANNPNRIECPLIHEALEEKFGCEITYDSTSSYNKFIHNKSIVSELESHPELHYAIDMRSQIIPEPSYDETDRALVFHTKALRSRSNVYESDFSLYRFLKRVGNRPNYLLNKTHPTWLKHQAEEAEKTKQQQQQEEEEEEGGALATSLRCKM